MTNSTVLLQKLIALESSIGKANNAKLRQLVHEAEDYLLQLQKEHAQGLFKDCWRTALQRLHSLREFSQDRLARPTGRHRKPPMRAELLPLDDSYAGRFLDSRSR